MLPPVLTVAQTNCLNPLQIDICPAIHLTGQTNAGMIDDASAPCNLPGEDLVYELTAPNGASTIFVSVMNATGPLECTLEQGSCGSGNCNTQFLNAGTTNVQFNVSNATIYYLWINAATTITFEISIGADTGTAVINVPNTKGNLQFDSTICALPPFDAAKPFFQVSYNGIYQTAPMTLSPLNVPGTMCVTAYFKNTTGVEGIKQFEFDFSAVGYSNVSPVSMSFAGFYNAGTWQATSIGVKKWRYRFTDIAAQGRGDFTGLPNTCLRYVFCFTITPLSNNPNLTNVLVKAFSDGFGSPYSAVLHMGCCPVAFLNCMGNGGVGGPMAGTASAFGFGFNDPGGTLPIVLTFFDAKAEDNKVKINWSTMSQTNNDFFTIEKSKNKYEWTTVAVVDGAGNCNSPLSYKIIDEHPFTGKSFYRLKQTDFNGAYSYSNIEDVLVSSKRWVIYPNPASNYIYIDVSDNEQSTFKIFNSTGELQQVTFTSAGNVLKLDITHLTGGLYYLIQENKNGLNKSERIVVNK